MVKIRIMLILELDPEEYPLPADGNIAEEFQDTMQELIHDVYGVKIKKIRTIQENQMNKNINELPTDYQNFIALSRYARWLSEENRREEWSETVDRYLQYMVTHVSKTTNLIYHQTYKIKYIKVQLIWM